MSKFSDCFTSSHRVSCTSCRSLALMQSTSLVTKMESVSKFSMTDWIADDKSASSESHSSMRIPAATLGSCLRSVHGGPSAFGFPHKKNNNNNKIHKNKNGIRIFLMIYNNFVEYGKTNTHTKN